MPHHNIMFTRFSKTATNEAQQHQNKCACIENDATQWQW